MKEYLALLEKARESLTAARVLVREGHPAFAASRAYYAMFYAAEALLESEGVCRSSHRGVIAEFGRRFVKTERLPRELHRFLVDALALRHRADYDTGPFRAERADELILQAERFLEAVEGLLPGKSQA